MPFHLDMLFFTVVQARERLQAHTCIVHTEQPQLSTTPCTTGLVHKTLAAYEEQHAIVPQLINACTHI